MTRTIVAVMAAVLAASALASCAGGTGTTATTATTGAETSTDVITHHGLDDIRIGDLRADLAREHGMTRAQGDCAPRLPEHPTASPVFDGDRLVLLWAGPPLRTPEGLGVGSKVDEVTTAHPDAETLSAPPETFRFDGLLVTRQDRASLFLHDGQTVQKLIVGSAEHARLLFHEDFGVC